MASTLAIPAIRTAVLAVLRNSVALTTYVGSRIYPDTNGDAPEKPAYPYVQVESSGETPLNTFGDQTDAHFGSETRINIRVGTQTRSDKQADAITGIIKGLLDGADLTVTGYSAAMAEWEFLTPMKDSQGGIVTREWVSTYLVTVSQ